MRKKFYIKTSLNIYCCVVQVSKDHETYEVDVYDGDLEGYFRKYLHEGKWLGGYEDMEFKDPLDPINSAKKFIDEWERPKRLENYLRLKNHFIHIKEDVPTKDTPPEPIPIEDYQEKAQYNYIQSLTEDPEKLERLPQKERDKLLKEYPDLRARYQQWFWIQREVVYDKAR